mgnify:CR=1 FL=1
MGNACFNERPYSEDPRPLEIKFLSVWLFDSCHSLTFCAIYRITKIYTTNDECMYKSIKLILGHEPRNVVQSLKLVEAVSSHI